MEIRKVRVSDIECASYQRPVSMGHAREIVKRFDETLFGFPLLSNRDGKWFVIDGQHRVNAALALNLKEIECQVVRNLTKEQEAELFLQANVQKRRLSGVDRTFAAIESGSETEKAMRDTFVKHGYEFVRGKRGRKPGTLTVRPGNAITVSYKSDPYAMDVTLEVLTSAYRVPSGTYDDGITALLCDAQIITGISLAVSSWTQAGLWNGHLRSALVSVLGNARELLSLKQVAIDQSVQHISASSRYSVTTAILLGKKMHKVTGKRQYQIAVGSVRTFNRSYTNHTTNFLSPVSAAV